MEAWRDDDFGREISLDVEGNDVHLIFHAGTLAKADKLVAALVQQLRAGQLYIEIAGTPARMSVSSH